MSLNKTLNESAACGVGLIVNVPQSLAATTRQLVVDAIAMLSSFEYRSGIHPVTDESDGAGIRLFGLAEHFFNQLIADEQFKGLDGGPIVATLESERFAIGQYFFAEDEHQIATHHQWISELCQGVGIKLLGWRNLKNAIDVNQLSVEAQQSMPSLWQCVIVPEHADEPKFEKKVQTANIAIIH